MNERKQGLAGEEISVWFGVSIFREKLPSSERETQEGMAGKVLGGGAVKGPDGRVNETRLPRDTVGDSCLFGAWSEDGRKKKFAANRNVFMEAGWVE